MQRCPLKSCCRAGDDIGSCGSGTSVPCPTPVEVSPEHDVVINCADCGLTRAADVRDLVGSSRDSRPIFTGCQRDPQNCRARVVGKDVLKGKAAKAKPDAAPADGAQ